MKAFTDLNQSKKLAEILPLESADMGWNVFVDGTTRILPIDDWDLVKDGSGNVKFYPAWSLATLINILPDTITDEDGTIFGLNIKKDFIEYYNPSMGALYATYHSVIAEDLVDACYEMILKLHEQKLL